MDDFTAEIIAGNNDPEAEPSPEETRHQDSYFNVPSPAASAATLSSPPKSAPLPSTDETAASKSWRTGGLRGKFSALKDKANIQDRLVEKLLSHVIPEEDGSDGNPDENDAGVAAGADDDVLAGRPGFNITTMSNNFRRFNARIGVVFRFQVRMIRLFSWRQTSHTLSFLAVYTFICLDTNFLVITPLAILLFWVLIPGFIARHPPLAPPLHPNHLPGQSGNYPYSNQMVPQSPAAAGFGGHDHTLQAQQYTAASMEYSPRGPPIAPARTVKPVKELSKDFFRNMRDLQNSMEDFSVAHDSIVALVVPATNFSDEALSSTIFVLGFSALLLLSIAAHLIPFRAAALVAGWGAVGASHPGVKRVVGRVATGKQVRAGQEEARGRLLDFASEDVVLDSAPETREVEIFELQRRDGIEWEPWLFTASPYDPLSAARIAGERPRGSRFFEDVVPPEGWGWSEKKWALDLWSRDWVEERIITAVEVETEGERWVYDMLSSYDRAGRDGDGGGGPVVVDYGGEREKARERERERERGGRGRGRSVGPSWEEVHADGEGDDGVGRRGEWRRRRWVRLVKRRVLGGEG